MIYKISITAQFCTIFLYIYTTYNVYNYIDVIFDLGREYIHFPINLDFRSLLITKIRYSK